MVAKTVNLPNIRKNFIPDPDHIIMEWDLDRADAQVVAWESGDEALKEKFRAGVDVHNENAKELFSVTPEHPEFTLFRHAAKRAIHATNYLVTPPTLASTLSADLGRDVTVQEAAAFINRWYELHPELKEWHERLEFALSTSRTIHNAFGYRRVYLDRINLSTLQEACAWIPQSTVALVINKGWDQLSRQVPEAEVLMQVHDSLVMQTHLRHYPQILPAIRDALLIEVPYPTPLTIPVGCKASPTSWGDVQDVDLAV